MYALDLLDVPKALCVCHVDCESVCTIITLPVAVSQCVLRVASLLLDGIILKLEGSRNAGNYAPSVCLPCLHFLTTNFTSLEIRLAGPDWHHHLLCRPQQR